ncbi:hypothetical protein HOP62_07505 [Halomonas sp. MCCC 1A17488]|uniref:hypothetical protein n=1 Tax=unclassified Halomonas TaxID=2609666 RepID=UPI0018D273A7|nr:MULTISPECIES: hypothetical protein [unclassified Halomonas]MCE8015919.1 hypothetical protein [Halomonas sp. MCCC 1A17488]MCG3239252.1 hypothetical protein [Halomonas sp. MCCC 1A17488]QPP50813.1 hypothetical protein I4484_06880 [Halomonas sp. SS10-MC5]
MNDHDYVNFSQDHELNYILKKFGKRQTEANRAALFDMGQFLKGFTGKARLQHGEFHKHVEQNLVRLES